MGFPSGWLRKFGANTIQSYVKARSDTFVSFKNPFLDLPFSDGAIDNYGMVVPPKSAGEMTVDMVVKVSPTSTDTNFQTELDTFYSIFNGETKKLFYAPADTATESSWRWVWARAIAASPQYDISQGRIANIQVRFIMAEPYWQNHPSAQYLGDGATFGSGGTITLGGNAQSNTVNFGTQAFIVTNSGNADAYPIFRFAPASTAYISNFTIKRLNPNYTAQVYEELRYSSDIVSGEVLMVDCRTETIRTNLANKNAYDYLTVGERQFCWMRLVPGNNYIAVNGTYYLDTAVNTDFYHTYHA